MLNWLIYFLPCDHLNINSEAPVLGIILYDQNNEPRYLRFSSVFSLNQKILIKNGTETEPPACDKVTV